LPPSHLPGDWPVEELDEEQRLMQATCRRYVDRVLRPFVQSAWQREWVMDPADRLPREILEEADRAGLRSLGIPARFGGVEVDPGKEAATFAVIASELARGDVGVADKLVQNWKVAVLLRALAPEERQEEWFGQALAEPGFLMAHCLTEPRGASDRWLPYDVPEAAMTTRAEHRNGRWVLNGRKHFISNGYDASLFVVYACTDPSVGMLSGTGSFVVPRGTPGLEVVRCNETVGGRFMNNGELVLEDCAVPEDHVLAVGDALGKAGIYFRPGKVLQAAKNLGIGQEAFAQTAEWVQSRVQGGRVLVEHQAVALRLAAMATRLEAAGALLRAAAGAVDRRQPEAEVRCEAAKLFTATEVFEVCRDAVELHGGAGAMLEVGVQKHLRDAAVYLHMDATSDITSFRLVKALFPERAGTYAGP
jgi:alkylation response protein AidB-like acyl-CoA dehydrogenase